MAISKRWATIKNFISPPGDLNTPLNIIWKNFRIDDEYDNETIKGLEIVIDLKITAGLLASLHLFKRDSAVYTGTGIPIQYPEDYATVNASEADGSMFMLPHVNYTDQTSTATDGSTPVPSNWLMIETKNCLSSGEQMVSFLDENITIGNSYDYKVVAVSATGQLYETEFFANTNYVVGRYENFYSYPIIPKIQQGGQNKLKISWSLAALWGDQYLLNKDLSDLLPDTTKESNRTHSVLRVNSLATFPAELPLSNIARKKYNALKDNFFDDTTLENLRERKGYLTGLIPRYKRRTQLSDIAGKPWCIYEISSIQNLNSCEFIEDWTFEVEYSLNADATAPDNKTTTTSLNPGGSTTGDSIVEDAIENETSNEDVSDDTSIYNPTKNDDDFILCYRGKNPSFVLDTLAAGGTPKYVSARLLIKWKTDSEAWIGIGADNLALKKIFKSPTSNLNNFSL